MSKVRLDLTKKYKPEFVDLDNKKNLAAKLSIIHHIFKNVITPDLSEDTKNLITVRVKLKPSIFIAYYKYPQTTQEIMKSAVKSFILNIRQSLRFAEENDSPFPPYLIIYVNTPYNAYERGGSLFNIPSEIKHLVMLYNEIKAASKSHNFKYLITVAYDKEHKEMKLFSKFVSAMGVKVYFGNHDECFEEINSKSKKIFTTL